MIVSIALRPKLVEVLFNVSGEFCGVQYKKHDSNEDNTRRRAKMLVNEVSRVSLSFVFNNDLTASYRASIHHRPYFTKHVVIQPHVTLVCRLIVSTTEYSYTNPGEMEGLVG